MRGCNKTATCIAVAALISGLPLAAIAEPVQDIDYQDYAEFESLESSQGSNLNDGDALDQAVREAEVDQNLVDIRRYSLEVERLQNAHGPYHPELAESLMGLGLAFQNTANHVEAIDHLKQALHVQRINQGLYDPSRIPLLEKLLVSYRATRDWQAVDDSWFSIMQLYRRNYDVADIRRLPAYIKRANWHLYAYERALDDQGLNHLANAQHYLYNANALVQHNFGAADLRQIDLLKTMVLVDFYLSREQPDLEADSPFDSKNSVPVTRASNFGNSMDAGFQSHYALMYRQGKRHLEHMIAVADAHRETDPQLTLEGQLMLADWHLLFGKFQRADTAYQAVWEASKELDNHEGFVRQAFANPVTIPTLDPLQPARSPNRADSPPNTGWIELVFDVSTSGSAKNLELASADDTASNGDINRAKRQLRRTRYRPLYIEGEPVVRTGATSAFAFRYEADELLAAANPDYADVPEKTGNTEPDAEAENEAEE